MSLITILISLAIESFWQRIDDFRPFSWCEQACQWTYQKLADSSWREGPAGVLAVIAPMVLGVGLVNAMLMGVWSGFGFIFAIIVVLYSLGPRGLARSIQAYLDAAEQGDHDSANQYASEVLGRQVDETPEQLTQYMKEAILVQANERLIGVLFWFVLLGPMGAVLFRASVLLKQQYEMDTSGFARSSRQLYHILFWIPARLCVLGYALAGSFIDTMSNWDGLSDFWQRESSELLIISGTGALRQEMREENEENALQFLLLGVTHTLALIKRTLIVLIVILALLTLAGWLV